MLEFIVREFNAIKRDTVKRMKKLIALTIAILMLLMTAACGAEPVAPADDNAKDKSLWNVLGKGQLILGLDANYPPMGYTDENGDIQGFDIDVAKEVCFRMGIELKMQPINWSEKEEILNSGEIDCIWNGMSVTPDRAESMTLSQPYMKDELIFMVPAKSKVRTFLDLEGCSVAVQSGSSTKEALENCGLYENINIVVMDDLLEMFEQLNAGNLDAILVDSVVAYYYIAKSDYAIYVLPEGLAEEKLAIGFRKGDFSLRDRIQEIMYEMDADGTLAKISTKWFGEDITILK